MSNVSILQKIKGHDDLTALDDRQRTQLCGEIREFLISNVSKTGGHLAGNLGVVELSVAIETVFNTEIDRLVFDVGHQSYVHKLLTGRQADFPHLRQYGGLSGFPKPSESDTDAFVAGHASSSVSIALGMARARTLLHQDYNVVALIGDGACTGGMAYEGLNDAAVSGEPMVIILNDNEMSIGRNVGGVSRHLSRLRSSGHYLKAKRWYREIMKKTAVGRAAYRVTRRLKNRLKRFLLPASLFENMGFTYLGPVDGHDLPGLISLLTTAKGLGEPVVVHVVTKKGCGYRFAEEDPAKFHGIGAFDPETGKKLAPKVKSYADSFGETIMELAREDDRICAITAAMPGGTGLLKFMREYPKRFFDVGIAEEHAISMAGGLAKQGMVPVAAIYSTFLQRAYDQLLHDVALQGLPVVFAVDRAGLVGEDGETHHGVFDLAYLRPVPNLVISSPLNELDLRNLMYTGYKECNGPFVIRYPRGKGEMADWRNEMHILPIGKGKKLRDGDDIAILSLGPIGNEVIKAIKEVESDGISIAHYDMIFLKPMDEELLHEVGKRFSRVITVENGVIKGGLGSAVLEFMADNGYAPQVKRIGVPDEFVEHGSIPELYKLCGMDAKSIAGEIKKMVIRG